MRLQIWKINYRKYVHMYVDTMYVGIFTSISFSFSANVPKAIIK